MTVSLEMRYHRPVPPESPLCVFTHVTDTEGRKVYVTGSIVTEEDLSMVLVAAEAVFVSPDPERAGALFPSLRSAPRQAGSAPAGVVQRRLPPGAGKAVSSAVASGGGLKYRRTFSGFLCQDVAISIRGRQLGQEPSGAVAPVHGLRRLSRTGSG